MLSPAEPDKALGAALSGRSSQAASPHGLGGLAVAALGRRARQRMSSTASARTARAAVCARADTGRLPGYDLSSSVRGRAIIGAWCCSR